MTYLTDNPWPLLMVLGAVAIVAFLSGSSKGRTFAGICLLLGIGLFFLEKALISPREEVEMQLELLLGDFKASDLDAIASRISSASPHLNDAARQGLDLVELADSFHIKSSDVTLEQDGQVAVALLRANGDITIRSHGQRYVPTFWKTTWNREDGVWKMKEVIRLNPANGQEIGYFAAQ